MGCRSSLAGLFQQDACRHPGLLLELTLYDAADQNRHRSLHDPDEAGTDVAALYAKAFDRWQEVLAVLGAQTWEVELLAGAPLVLVPGLYRGPALSLHQVYAVPYIPGAVLAALAGVPHEEDGAAEKDGVDPSRAFDVLDRTLAATFLDAWHVPATAPEGVPTEQLSERGGHGATADLDTDSTDQCGDDAVRTGPVWTITARGSYLIAAIGQEDQVSAARGRLSLAMQHAWGTPVAAAPGEEDASDSPAETPLEPCAAVEAPSATGEPVVCEPEPEGPRAWGLRSVVLVPQDGSLRAEGPAGEKGVAAKAEAEILMAGLPEDMRERFKARKRRAKLLVTVEPRGNVWRIIGLEVEKAGSEESPEQTE